MSKVFTLNCATITVIDDQLLEIIYTDDYKVELEDAIAVDRFYHEFAKGKNGLYSIMNTQGRYSPFTNEAQEYFAQKSKLVNGNLMLGNALVIDSLANRLLARFFLSFYRPKFPCKLFSNYNKARSWIEDLRLPEKQIES